MAELITLGLICKEDLSLGYGTLTPTLLDQSTPTLNSINLSNFLPAYTVAYSATPVFDLVNGAVQSITLTGNVTSSTFVCDSATVPTNAVLVLRIIQDGSGAHTFVWPTNVTGRSNITVGAAASAITIATLLFNGTNWEFTGIPIIVGTVGLVNGGITGTGTSPYLAKFTSGSAIAISGFYDNGNSQMLCGSTTTDYVVSTNPYIVTIGNNGGFATAGATTSASVGSLIVTNGTYVLLQSTIGSTGSPVYLPLAFATNGAEVARFTTDKQLLIGATTTDVPTPVVRVVTIANNSGFVCAGATSGSSYGQLVIVNTSYLQIKSSSVSGTTLPIQFSIDATEVGRFRTDGQFLVGGNITDAPNVVPRIVAIGNNGGFIAVGGTAAAAYGSLGIINGSYAQLKSSSTPGGTTLPLQFSIDTTEVARFKVDGSFYLGLASSDRGGGPYVISKVPYIVATGTAAAEYVELGNIAGSYAYISTSHTVGGGVTRPLVFGVDAVEKMRLSVAGQLFVGGSSSDIGSLGTSTILTMNNNNGFICASATTNASYGAIGVLAGSYVQIKSAHSGSTGTLLPLQFAMDSTEIARFTTVGQLLLGGASTDISGLGNATVMVMATGNGLVCATATTNSSYLSIGINAGGTAVIESFKSGGAGVTLPIGIQMGAIECVRLAIDGGLTINTNAGALPTGGSKGAGTINIATDIYKNGSVMSQPKWALQHYFTGKTDASGFYAAPAGYTGLLPIEKHKAFTQEHHDLPLMTLTPDGGLFERGDLLLASLEEAYLYIYELHQRIDQLEKTSVRL